jgi:hypothetical protein
MPDSIIVREITVHVQIPGFRTDNIIIVTTLLDHKEFPAQKFAELYLLRWRVELFLRDIKITMGLDILRCKTPQMVEKELWLHVSAYNLIRSVMAEAAQKFNLPPHLISFKGTVTTLREWEPFMARTNLAEGQMEEMYNLLLYYLAKDKIPKKAKSSRTAGKKTTP